MPSCHSHPSRQVLISAKVLAPRWGRGIHVEKAALLDLYNLVLMVLPTHTQIDTQTHT